VSEQELIATTGRRFNLNEVGVFRLFYRHDAFAERARYLRTGYLEEEFRVFLQLKLRLTIGQEPAYS